MSARDRPRKAPFRKTFSRPDRSGWKPAANSNKPKTLPAASRVPEVGRIVPASNFSSVLLPAPFRPMIPNVRPASTSNVTPSSAQNSSRCPSAVPPRSNEIAASCSVPARPRRITNRLRTSVARTATRAIA